MGPAHEDAHLARAIEFHHMDDTQTIERGGRRWRVCARAAEPLLAGGWPLDDPARLTVVKQGAGRTVCRCQAGGVIFFVKRYTGGGLLRQLRARLGLGPARREWDALLAAGDAGIDVPEPVALALAGEETLVTREIPAARRLDEYLFDRYFEPLPGDPPYPGARPPELVSLFRRRRVPPEGTITPRDLADGLADVLARLARADLYLPDLHPGNILISGGPGAWRLSVVDLAEAVHPATDETTLKHLMQLEHFFEPIASASERLRCLERVRARGVSVPNARTVARATAQYRHRFYNRRDRRTRRESKYFRRIIGGGWHGWATADWADAVQALLARAAEKGSDPFSGRAVTLKEGRTSTVRRMPLDDGRQLVLKRHNRADERDLVQAILRPSRSMAAFRLGHALLARGIATARPAAAMDYRPGSSTRDTLLATEFIAGGEPLSDWLRRNPPAAARHRVTWLLARLVRRMHDLDISQRDLKAPNILIAPDSGAGPRPVLIDLDGLRVGHHVSSGRRAQNLMRLSVSLDEWGVARRTDRLRFLRAYLGRKGCMRPIAVLGRRRGSTRFAERLRRWWKRIARSSARKMAALQRKQAKA